MTKGVRQLLLLDSLLAPKVCFCSIWLVQRKLNFIRQLSC